MVANLNTFNGHNFYFIDKIITNFLFNQTTKKWNFICNLGKIKMIVPRSCSPHKTYIMKVRVYNLFTPCLYQSTHTLT